MSAKACAIINSSARPSTRENLILFYEPARANESDIRENSRRARPADVGEHEGSMKVCGENAECDGGRDADAFSNGLRGALVRKPDVTAGS